MIYIYSPRGCRTSAVVGLWTSSPVGLWTSAPVGLGTSAPVGLGTCAFVGLGTCAPVNIGISASVNLGTRAFCCIILFKRIIIKLSLCEKEKMSIRKIKRPIVLISFVIQKCKLI